MSDDKEMMENNLSSPQMNEGGAEAPQVEQASAEENLRREAEEWRDKYLRKLAEFENYRKRTRNELNDVREIVSESLLLGLLPVLDDFDRVLADEKMPQDDPYRKGVELIRGKLWSFFESRGVSRLECLGKSFDPAQHEALAVQPTGDFPPNTVLVVITHGYRMGERVIRHAQVIVSNDSMDVTDTGETTSADEFKQ